MNNTKLNKLKTCYTAGDLVGALRIASRFPQLGEHKEVITRAWAAHTNRQFYIEIGQDPDALFDAGITALRERYAI
jgi:hypothetical protein